MSKIQRSPGSSVAGLILVAALLALGVSTVSAQVLTEPIPRVVEAEEVFDQGLDAFRAGDYGMAYRRFRLVIDSYPFNQRTTAAVAMSAKALYRDGRLPQAIAVADEFLRQYPSSRYVDEIRRVRDFARHRIDEEQRRRPVLDLGIILPLSGSATVTQSLFNGVRLAVEAHNRASGDVLPVRMNFRDTHGDPATAREVVADLAQQGVDIIIGPIFSDEARAAADEADRRGVVMLAPLATDEDVAEGRRFVFQANPPISTRGRVMARHAIREGFESFGVVARLRDDIGERMAEGFEDEVFQEARQLRFYHLVEANADWERIPEAVGVDTLQQTDALYLAFAGSNAPQIAESVLSGLIEAGVSPRIFGGDGWHDLPDPSTPSRFETTYATDFFIDPASSGVQDFDRRYRALAEELPDRVAYTGYDVTTYVLSRKLSRPDHDFRTILHNDISYQGLGLRLDFSRGNVNQALYIFGYRNGRAELLR